MIRTLFVLLLAAWAAAAPARPLASLPLERPWLGLPQVPVTLNDRVSARFIVDTAASETLMTDALIERLRLRATDEPAQVSGATGSSRLNHYRLDSLRLGDREFRLLDAFDFPPLAEPVGADGLLGADVLRRHVVEFDMPRSRLVLHERRSDLMREGPGWIAVPAYSRSDGFLIVAVRIGRLTLPALVDTGAVHNIVNAEAARLIGIRVTPDSASREPVTGASGHIQTMNTYEISGFSLAGERFGPSRLGVVDLSIFDVLGMDGPAMILSAEALAGRRFVIDYPRSRLLIARTRG